MPELPEVETVRRTLAPALGLRVVGVSGSNKPLRGKRPPVTALRRRIQGGVLRRIRRWGKYLLLDFDPGERFLLVHLGMTGRLRLFPIGAEAVSHTHLCLLLEGKARQYEMRFTDPRRFGSLSMGECGQEKAHPSLGHLGPDPLVDGLEGAQLHEASRGRQRNLKTFLLDQRIVAGVGNIYASEALWRANLPPGMSCSRLSRARADDLAEAVVAVLEDALGHGGTTLRDFVAADGVTGSHSEYLQVYGREGEPCRRGCGGHIRRVVHQARATFYCPNCQRH